MQTAISITTINIPTVLDGLTRNICRHGHHQDVMIIVTGDNKTPDSAGHYIGEVAKNTGVDILWMGVRQQQKYLKDFPALDRYLPYNSLGRRNVGDLVGYARGADIIIRLDDDNECIEQTGDFVGGHARNLDADRPRDTTSILQPDPWWRNVLDEFCGDRGLRHRGWPAGVGEAAEVEGGAYIGRCVISESFCLGEPDLDATARLPGRCPQFRQFDNPESNRTWRLHPYTWHPINTQATAFHRDIMPVAFVDPAFRRYDDIWCGYLCRAVMDLKGWGCSLGAPVVGHFQWRTTDSILRDLQDEVDGMRYTPKLIEILTRWKGQEKFRTGGWDVMNYAMDLAREETWVGLPRKPSAGLQCWLEALGQI